jgi:hypothetical protein
MSQIELQVADFPIIALTLLFQAGILRAKREYLISFGQMMLFGSFLMI